jgi:uncharacterized membrane protein SpoIIM required for sporulation
MKESRFIQQNKDKWQELESLLAQKNADPDRLSELYVEVTDDLSYAKTYYPHRLVRAYLNNISQKIYLSIYKNKPKEFFKIKDFWVKDLPLSIWHARYAFYISLFVYALGMGIGVISCLNDAEFANKILGDTYVNMTLENIAKGDPMAVYKDSDEAGMFLRIAWNNLMVSFRIFFSGILLGMGSLLYLLKNAIMVGTFQFFFFDKGVFIASFITIWQHGTIEISCLVIASAAGITMGKGLVFPGTYPRMQALRLSAFKGIRIMAGITPLIILAAIIESFITRLTEAPIAFRIGVLIVSALLIIYYFIVLPYYVAEKQGFPSEKEIVPERVPELNEIKLLDIKETGKITIEALQIFRQQLRPILGASVLFSIAFALILTFGTDNSYFNLYKLVSAATEDFLYSIFIGMSYFVEFYNNFIQYNNTIELTGLWFLILIVLFNSYYQFKKYFKQQKTSISAPRFSNTRIGIEFAAMALICMLPVAMGNFLGWLLFYILFVLCNFFIAGRLIHDNSISECFGLLTKKRPMLLGTMSSTFLIHFCLLLLTSGASAMIILDFFQSNFAMTPSESKDFFHVFMLGISLTAFLPGLHLMAFGIYLSYFSNYEAGTADDLQTRIEKTFPL